MKGSLYYDGACPLCNKEMSLLKRLCKDCICFVNIHEVEEVNLPHRDTLLKRLHLKKTNGEWLVGLDANVFVWSQTRYGIFFKVLRIWPVRPVADFIYNRWADKRFKTRYACDQCHF